MNKIAKGFAILVFLCCLPECSGNSGSNSGTNLAEDLPREVGICFGRVIDRSTRAGLSSAAVEVFAGAIPSTAANASQYDGTETNFVARTTTASDDADTTLFDESGMWRIENLPTDAGGGTGYRVRIGATNYATMQTTCAFGGASQDNTPIAQNMGDLALTSAVSLTAYLSDDGSAVSGCTVFAIPTSTTDVGGGSNATLGGIEIAATTDADGAASLTGLNPLISYTIVAPACDSDSDGDYDFQTVVVLALDSAIDSNTALQMEASPVGRDDALAFVDTNATLMADSGGVSFTIASLLGTGGAATVGGIDDMLSIGTADNIVLVFNFPVSIDSSPGIGLDFSNNLLLSTGVAGFPVLEGVDLTCTLGAGNTILTCDPASDLAGNEMYTLTGTVAANVPSGTNAGTANRILNLGDLDGDGTVDSWYVFDASANGLADTTSVTADNYNGAVSGAVGTDLVYLEFPELVYGTWRVISTTDSDPNDDGSPADAATTSELGGACMGNLTTSAGFLYEGNDPDTAGVVTGMAADGTTVPTGSAEAAGCTGTTCPGTRIVYRVPLSAAGCTTGGNINVNDTEAATARTVRVFVDATDVEGNRLQGEFNLGVE